MHLWIVLADPRLSTVRSRNAGSQVTFQGSWLRAAVDRESAQMVRAYRTGTVLRGHLPGVTGLTCSRAVSDE